MRMGVSFMRRVQGLVLNWRNLSDSSVWTFLFGKPEMKRLSHKLLDGGPNLGATRIHSQGRRLVGDVGACSPLGFSKALPLQ